MACTEYSSNVGAFAFKSALPNLIFKSGHTREVLFVQPGGLHGGGCRGLEVTSARGPAELAMRGAVSPQPVRIPDSSGFGRSDESIPRPLSEESLVSFPNRKTRRLPGGTVQTPSAHSPVGYSSGLCTGTRTVTGTGRAPLTPRRLSLGILFTGELWEFLSFAERYPTIIYNILLFGLTSALGQVRASRRGGVASLRETDPAGGQRVGRASPDGPSQTLGLVADPREPGRPPRSPSL